MRDLVKLLYKPFKAVAFVWSQIERRFYTLRDIIWDYPTWAFEGEESMWGRFSRFYQLTRPLSYFITAFLVLGILVLVLLSLNSLVSASSRTLIEGVVVGSDDNGQLQKLSRVNPLLPTSIQLEKDLAELVYEPLIRVNQDGSITPVLAESVLRIQEGSDYEFVLRSDVFWHDNKKFGVDDVIRSLEIVSQLEESNSYVQAVKQMAWEKTGERTLRICTSSAELQQTIASEDSERVCSGVKAEKPILANFLELISFKILPAHLSADVNALTIATPEPRINRFPVGTGKYKFDGATEDKIFLSLNTNYYDDLPEIENIELRLFTTEAEATQALLNGEIHSVSSSSTENIRRVEAYPQIDQLLSPVLQNQYWAIYFNLRKDLEGNPLGPDFFQDVAVRRALSMAINRQEVLQALLNVGDEALGPIPKQSEFFNASAGWYRYDQQAAEKALDDAGWVYDPSLGLRRKDNKVLSFKLSYVDNYDRNKVVEVIVRDLKEIGVEAIADPHELSELSNQVVTPKLFDTLLYGMSTFIDPDRYELFHSEQDLNLASYVGTDETVKIEGGSTVRLPRVDKLLEQGRSFDPFAAKDKRLETYQRVQELVAADAPLVFLYHPQFIYYVNSRVRNVDLTNAASLEQRFRNIEKWEITR